MSIGFFFWVMDRLMKPYLKGFSIVATIIIFLVAGGLCCKVSKEGFSV